MQVAGRAPGPSSISQMSTESYMIRRELDSRFLNSTPNLGTLLPPPPLSATSGPNKLMDPSSLYSPMMPPMVHGLPGLNPSPYPPHSVGYGVNSVPSSVMSVSSAMVQQQNAGGLLSNLGGMSLPTAPPSLSLPSKVCHKFSVHSCYYSCGIMFSFSPQKKPGKWNAMHVRIAWEIHQNQQRQPRDPHSDPKKMMNLNLAPKLNLGISAVPPPGPTSHSLPPHPTHAKSAGGFDTLSSSLNSHNSPFSYAHHNMAGFLPRIPSVPTPPPSHHSMQPPGGVRHSPAPDQWNR